MKTAIVGTRKFNDYAFLTECLKEYKDISLIISGGAQGTDTLARNYAESNNIPYKEIKPDYNKYPGRYAPIKRNEEIVRAADRLIAFWDMKSPGTKSAIKFAKKHRLQIKVISVENNLDPSSNTERSTSNSNKHNR